MTFDTTADAAMLRKQRQFLEQIERNIREANREIIHARIPVLGQEGFVDFAHRVARLRASYLQAALEAGTSMDDDEPSPWVESLRRHREAYEEAREAFDALQRAIERGYVDMGLEGA